MKVELSLASSADIPTLENLMQLYLYDFSEFDCADVDGQGRYSEYLDLYWTKPERHPFLIWVNGWLAGFVLVHQTTEQDGGSYYEIDEFFVLRKYRRQGVGRLAARAAFDRFPGRWKVAQEKANIPAQEFWRKIIAEYTNGVYEENTPSNQDWLGPVQTFTSFIKGV